MKTIGILGAGQLSRMLALAGISMGFDFIFYNDKASSSVQHLGRTFLGSFDDEAALTDFANHCDLITIENENIPVTAIKFLKSLKPVFPDVAALEVSQDRVREKQLFRALDIPTVDFEPIHSMKEALAFGQKNDFPFVIKSRRFGYDGKNQIKINSEGQLLTINHRSCMDAICEDFIQYDRELSIIATVSQNGTCEYFDICENRHQEGILIQTQNKPNDPIFPLAKTYVDRLIQHLGYVGTIALEFFQVGDQLIANEFAPRVHNSGHWTIEGAYTSQFENHIRAIAELPLGQTKSRDKVTLYNIIGKMSDKKQSLKDKLHYIHDYNKEEKAGRKLGHITVMSQ